MEVWEGYATDPEIRFKGSSGGAVTAIALFCLQHEQMAGVLHVGANLESPLQNVPFFSKNKEELLARTGSRYSPAAPCEKLKWIEQADSPCVFIGKPCDVAALRKSQSINQTLNDKIGLAVSIFCAGTPTTKGTYDLLATLGVKPQGVSEIRYRGYGWPGKVTVKVKGSDADVHQLSYSECWGKILSNFGQFRCLICPDTTGEFADIACGDPWHRKVEQSQPGYSLVLVRTEKGREILHRAMRLGYVTLAPAHISTLPRSQPALLNGRRTLFGQLLAMHLMRLPTPSFNGFSLIENWHQLKFWNRFRPVLAMLWHTISEKLYRPQKKYLSGTITVNEDFASPAVIKTISREET